MPVAAHSSARADRSRCEGAAENSHGAGPGGLFACETRPYLDQWGKRAGMRAGRDGTAPAGPRPRH